MLNSLGWKILGGLFVILVGILAYQSFRIESLEGELKASKESLSSAQTTIGKLQDDVKKGAENEKKLYEIKAYIAKKAEEETSQEVFNWDADISNSAIVVRLRELGN